MTSQPATRVDADVAIIGSGFSGSLTALALLKRGQRVVLIERGRHPRFACSKSWRTATICRGFGRSRSGARGSAPAPRLPAA